MNSAEHPPVAQPRGPDRTSSSPQLQSEELDQVHELIDAAVADSTKQVYTAYPGLYDRWLEDRGLPRTPETLALYLNARHREGLSKLALENPVSAASWDDPNTFRGHEGVQVVLGGIRRIDLRPSDPVKGLVEGVLEPVVTLLGDAVFMALAAIDAGGVEGTGSSNK